MSIIIITTHLVHCSWFRRFTQGRSREESFKMGSYFSGLTFDDISISIIHIHAARLVKCRHLLTDISDDQNINDEASLSQYWLSVTHSFFSGELILLSWAELSSLLSFYFRPNILLIKTLTSQTVWLSHCLALNSNYLQLQFNRQNRGEASYVAV